MLRLAGIVVNLGGFTLEVDSLELAPGEYLIILGPNGAGKTVLLETIAGLHGLVKGLVEFQEETGWSDVTAWPPEKRRVGFVYQDYLLFPHLSVSDNIGFGLKGRVAAPARAERVREAAKLTNVEGLLGRRVLGLSGGERQRVALARALAIRPRLLLLDEPLAALDRSARREMADEVRRLCRDLGVTVMHVTHSLEEAVSLGDRVAVLADGRVLQIGPPRELLEAPANRQVAELVGCENLLAGILSDSMVTVMGGPTLRVRGKRDSEVAGEVTVALRAEDLSLQLPSYSEPPAPGSNLFPVIVEAVEPGPAHWTVRVRYTSEPGLPPTTGGRLDDGYPVESPPAFTIFVMPPELSRLAVHPGSLARVYVDPKRVRVCQS